MGGWAGVLPGLRATPAPCRTAQHQACGVLSTLRPSRAPPLAGSRLDCPLPRRLPYRAPAGPRRQPHQGPDHELLPPLLPQPAQAARLPGGVHHPHHQGGRLAGLTEWGRWWADARMPIFMAGRGGSAGVDARLTAARRCLLFAHSPRCRSRCPRCPGAGHQGARVHLLLHAARVRGVEGGAQYARLVHQVLQGGSCRAAGRLGSWAGAAVRVRVHQCRSRGPRDAPGPPRAR